VLRKRGETWSELTPGLGGFLFGLWADGSDGVWIRGAEEENGGLGARLTLRAEGQDVGPAPVFPRSMTGLWNLGPREAWAAGHQGALAHWDGSRWRPDARASAVLCPAPWDDARAFCAIEAFWGERAEDLWAYGQRWRMNGPAELLVARWDGKAWGLVATHPLPASLWGLRGVGPGEVWAWSKGTLSRWKQGAWWSRSWLTAVGDPLIHINGMWSAGPDEVWAVGWSQQGTHSLVWRWSGAEWTPMPHPEARSLAGVWGSGPGDVWVASASQSRVMHWDGQRWRGEDPGAAHGLRAIVGTGRELWIAGDGGMLLRRRLR
jgi:hypothetical protein